jgi:hypothetical protein
VEGGREMGQKMNMVHIMCTHVSKLKMILVETIPGIGRA